MVKRIIVMRHAKNRMRRYRRYHVDSKLVADVVLHPERVTPGHPKGFRAWRRLNGRWLRVAYAIEGDVALVVTVTMPRRGPSERR